MKVAPRFVFLLLLAVALSCQTLLPSHPELTPVNGTLSETGRLGRGAVGSAAFSPDGRLLAVATATGLGFYDAQTLDSLHFEDAEWAMSVMAFSPDGGTLVVAEDAPDRSQHRLQFWSVAYDDAVTLTPLRTVSILSFADDLVFSPDGQYLAFAAGRVNLLRASDGELVKSISGGFFANYEDVAFSPDGALLAATGPGGSEQLGPTHLWRVRDLAAGVDPDKAMPYDPGSSDDSVIVFAPDGATFLAGKALRRTGDGQVVRAVAVRYPAQAVFSPDGDHVFVVDSHQCVAVETATGEVSPLLPAQRYPKIALSPDGETLVTVSDGSLVQAWAVATLLEGGMEAAWSGELPPFSDAVSRVAFTSDGQNVVANEFDQVRFWSLDGVVQQSFPDVPSGFPLAADFSPDSALLALQNADGLRIWRASDHTVLHALDVSFGAAALVFSPDGRLLAVAAEEGFQIWQTESGALLYELDGLAHDPRRVVFSPDGQWVAADGLGDNLTVGMWDLDTGALQFQVKGAALIGHILFSPDGQWLATAADHTNDLDIRLWRMSDGALSHTLSGHKLQISALAFSPDGQMLASGEGNYARRSADVRVWRASDGELLQTLSDHPDRITDLAFTDDGLLYVASGNRVYVWRVSDGTLLYRLEGHTFAVSDLALSPDGATLATGSRDGTVRLWAVPRDIQ